MWPGRPMISAYRALVTVLVHLWIHFVVFVGSCPSRFFVGRFSRPFGFCGPGSSGGRLWVAWQLVKWGLAADWCFVSSFFSESQHVPATPVVDQEPLSLQSSRIRGWASAGLQGFKHDQEHLLYFGCHAVIDHLFKYVPWVMCMPHGMHMVYTYLHTFRSSGHWPFQEPKLEVPTIYKAYVREYPHNILPYMVQYLHFRILEFPLIWVAKGMIWDASMGVQSPKSQNLPKSCLLLTYHLGYFDHIFGILTMTTYDYNDSVGQPSGFVIQWFDQNRNPEKFNGEKTRSKQKLGELQWLRMKSSVFVEVPL